MRIPKTQFLFAEHPLKFLFIDNSNAELPGLRFMTAIVKSQNQIIDLFQDATGILAAMQFAQEGTGTMSRQSNKKRKKTWTCMRFVSGLITLRPKTGFFESYVPALFG